MRSARSLASRLCPRITQKYADRRDDAEPGVGCFVGWVGVDIVECASDVVVLELEAVQPLELAGAAQFGSGGLGHRQEVVAVTATRRHPFVVAAARKLFRGVLANGLEEPVARRFGGEVRFDETLVDERADDAEHIVHLNRDSVGGDCFGGIERPASREHGEACEHEPFALGEQLV